MAKKSCFQLTVDDLDKYDVKMNWSHFQEKRKKESGQCVEQSIHIVTSSLDETHRHHFGRAKQI